MLFLGTVWCASCSNDERPETASGNDMTLAFTLRVSGESTTRATTWGENDSPEDASYDDAINIDDIHVAIFKSDGSLLDIEKMSIYKNTSGAYVYCGRINRSDYTADESYRCMVVVNAGASEVDFANLGSLTFEQSSLPNADQPENYIPMWGVKSFTIDEEAEKQELGVIELLRASVKCRVHFSEELLAAHSDLSLVSVQFHSHNVDGYVVPKEYDTASSTEAIDYTSCIHSTMAKSEQEVAIVNGLVEIITNTFDPVDFFAEPEVDTNAEGGTLSAVGYFCECISEQSAPYLTITVQVDNRNLAYEVKFADLGIENLIRNYVYDITITGYNYGLTIELNAGTNWNQILKSYSYEAGITFKPIDGYESKYITWEEDTYMSIDETNKVVILASNTDLQGSVYFLTPVNGTWIATLTATSADDTANSIIFDDENQSSYTSGTIDGSNAAVFRIKAASENDSRQHIYTLNLYVRYPTGVTEKVQSLSGWQIIQTY